MSAGRVQSVALRLIVDREKERDAFKPEEYWKVFAYCSKNKVTPEKIFVSDEDEVPEISEDRVQFDLIAVKDKDPEIGTKKNAKEIVEEVIKKEWQVDTVERKDLTRNPPAPFITSTLQRTASSKIGYSASRTMRIAQGLYEKGLITYMRTDSTNIADSAVKSTRKFIGDEYGKKYLSKEVREFKTKSKLAQEAHEAIRPTDVKRTPDSAGLSGAEKKLYDLIWRRAVATQMAKAKLQQLVVTVRAGDYTFQAKGLKIVFPGFMKILRKAREQDIGDFTEGEAIYPKRSYWAAEVYSAAASIFRSSAHQRVGEIWHWSSINICEYYQYNC